MEYNIDEAKKYLKMYIRTRIPVMMLGAPGVGKTVGLFDVCKELAIEGKFKGISQDIVKPEYFNIIDYRASQVEYSDIKGLPYPDSKQVNWLMPAEFAQIKEGTHGVLFFDELTQANEDVQKALFQLIHDRRLGNFVMPDTWSVVAAGNRLEDKSHVTPLSMALNNRFNHMTITNSVDSFSTWGIKNDVRFEILSFLKFKPEHLHRLENHKFPAFPTPRSWKRASDLIQELNLEKKEDIEYAYNILSQTVGDGVAMEWKSYQELTRKIDIDEILNKPSKAKELTEISQKYALVSAVAIKYRNNKDKKKEIELTDKICELSFQLEDEFATFMLKLLVEFDVKFADNLSKSKHRKTITEKYYKYFNYN